MLNAGTALSNSAIVVVAAGKPDRATRPLVNQRRPSGRARSVAGRSAGGRGTQALALAVSARDTAAAIQERLSDLLTAVTGKHSNAG